MIFIVYGIISLGKGFGYEKSLISQVLMVFTTVKTKTSYYFFFIPNILINRNNSTEKKYFSNMFQFTI